MKPQEVVETNRRNDMKVMMVVDIVDGKIPIVHSFIGEDCKSASLNGCRYLELLEQIVWPALRSFAKKRY